MKKISRSLFSVLLVVLLFGFGCVKQKADVTVQKNASDNQFATVIGKAEETLDGFYVNGYLLEDNEMIKYKSDYKPEDYIDKNLEIKGKVKQVDKVCEPYTQCREGSYQVIYDVQSIKINK